MLRTCLIPLAEVEHALPARIGNYTDFYTSIHHALNVGRLIFPTKPLTPTSSGCRSPTTAVPAAW